MYSQKDPRWSWHTVGTGKKNIGQVGCLLTCCAQLLTNYGIQFNPGQLNYVLKMTNQYVDNNLIPDKTLQNLCPDRIKHVGRAETRAPVELSLLHREPGEEIILKIDGNPAAGEQRHFVILKDVEGDRIIIADPLPGVNPFAGWVGDFSKRYGDPRQNILAVIKYWFKEVK